MKTPREWVMLLIGLIVTACVAMWGIDQHDARIRREAQFADSAHRLAVRTSFLEARVSDAANHVKASAETVTVKRTSYRTLRDTITLYPVTPADTAKAVAALPEIVNRADDALHADSVHQANATKLQAESDSLVGALRTERDLWRKAKVFSPPRVTSVVAVLYEPVGHVPAASAQTSFRLTERLSAIARADQRFAPGEPPRAAVGIALTF